MIRIQYYQNGNQVETSPEAPDIQVALGDAGGGANPESCAGGRVAGTTTICRAGEGAGMRAVSPWACGRPSE